MWRHEVPLEIIRPMSSMVPMPLLATAADVLFAIRVLAWAVRVPGEDLYPPLEYLQDLYGGWSMERGRAVLEATQESFRKGEPIHPPKPPRPNEPCSCGSGKKYKKCCWKARLAR
jgi:hypothetical protein